MGYKTQLLFLKPLNLQTILIFEENKQICLMLASSEQDI